MLPSPNKHAARSHHDCEGGGQRPTLKHTAQHADQASTTRLELRVLGKGGIGETQRGTKALGAKVVEWEKVREGAMAYCQRKKDEHRFDGKGKLDMNKVPTYDLVERKETVP